MSSADHRPYRPTPDEIRAAAGRTIPDVIAPGLKVLFCGINPGLYSGAVGHHFARPGNRFWPALHLAGLTPRRLAPHEDGDLPEYGLGVVNFVARATASADELSREEIVAGGQRLTDMVLRYQPGILAVLGIGAYRDAFGRPKAAIGPQPERIGATRIWALPNPSGLNAHYSLDALAGLLRELKAAAGIA